MEQQAANTWAVRFLSCAKPISNTLTFYQIPILFRNDNENQEQEYATKNMDLNEKI